MRNKYGAFLKTLRGEKGLSQSVVAQKLGVSRSSYIAIEQGVRELSLAEAEKLSALLGISIESLTNATTPHYEKYKEMILAFLRAMDGDGRVPKTKLAKLLYLADFAWFYENLSSMSGMQYIRREYGPVPDPYFRALTELEEAGKISIERKDQALLVRIGAGAERPQLKTLSDDEKSLIKKISAKWKGKRTQEIVNFTHEQLPYKLCAPDEAIPYELITQEDPEYVY